MHISSSTQDRDLQFSPHYAEYPNYMPKVCYLINGSLQTNYMLLDNLHILEPCYIVITYLFQKLETGTNMLATEKICTRGASSHSHKIPYVVISLLKQNRNDFTTALMNVAQKDL